MQRLFSVRYRTRLFRELWIILAEGEKLLGLSITDEQICELKAHVDDINLNAIAAYEKKLRHDVMANVHAYGDLCPKARPIIHLGATSCYVGDNADVMIMREGLQLLLCRLVEVARKLSHFCKQYAGLPTLGYTHFQAAQPTTVGKRATLWLHDVLFDIEETRHVLDSLLPLGSKGTTGTQASFLDLFDGDREKVKALDAYVANRMGFEKAVPVSGQTYSRKQDSMILNLLSQIAQTAYKFSNDLRLLQHLKEVEEPFEKHQIGSSAMPYKRNPMRSERMAGIARFLIANAQNAAMTASQQWLERTLDDSSNRRISLSEGFLAADGLLVLFDNVVDGLVVYPKMIEKHLDSELPFMATENLLMEAVKKGGDRQTLHEKLRVYAMEAGKQVKEEGLENNLLHLVAKDKDFGLDENDMAQLLDQSQYIGCAKIQTEEFLRGEVADTLARYEHLQAPESKLEV